MSDSQLNYNVRGLAGGTATYAKLAPLVSKTGFETTGAKRTKIRTLTPSTNGQRRSCLLCNVCRAWFYVS